MSITYGAGLASWLEPDRVLELRDQHPAGHAGFGLEIDEADGVVTAARMRVGYMHRGAEKLFESRDYRQAMMLADRHDWLSAFHSELMIALALEQTMGITPPERATWSRMIVAEANRIAALLAFIAPVLDDDPRRSASACREAWLQAQEAATGMRVHAMYARLGGVAHPLDESAFDALRRAAELTEASWPSITEALEAYAESLAGLAVLTLEQAVAFGASGVVAHGSGLPLDMRRAQPYLAYEAVAEALPVLSGIACDGDARSRYLAMLPQVPASLACIREALDRLAGLDGAPVDVLLPKTVRAPEGTTMLSIEGPLGIMGCVLVSAGDVTPYRLRVRTASYNNAQAMQAALVGTPVERLGEAVMSFPFVVGDIDR